MKGFSDKKKFVVGGMIMMFSLVILGMSNMPKLNTEAATTEATSQLVCFALEEVDEVVTEQELDVAISSLTGESIARLESMVPDEAKLQASEELGATSRGEYLKWFYYNGYIPGELLGVNN